MNKRRISLFSVPITLLLLAVMVMALPAAAQQPASLTLNVGHNLGTAWVSTHADAETGSTDVYAAVEDASANAAAGAIDFLNVSVRSTTDSTGFNVLLHETGVNTGIFAAPNTRVNNEAVGNGDGAQTVFNLANPNASNVSVTVDGNAVTNFTVDNAAGTITFNPAPANGVAIVASYSHGAGVVFGGVNPEPTVSVTIDPSDSRAFPPELNVQDGDTVRIVYERQVFEGAPPVFVGTEEYPGEVRVDSVLPTITQFSPTNDSAFSSTSTFLQVVATDTGAGFTEAAADHDDVKRHARFTLGPLSQGADPDADPANLSIFATQNASVTDSGRVLSASANVGGLGTQNGVLHYQWNGRVLDRAGNIARITTETIANVPQNPKFTVDRQSPSLFSALTGINYDATNNVETRNGRWVRALFNESDRLDPASVEPTDFTVGGATPVAVVVPNSRPTNIAGNATPADRFPVYLQMASSLASDAKPVVQLVGAVRDRAGNQSGITQVTADDGIQPTLNVTVDGDAGSSRPVAKSEVRVTITSDEDLTGTPTVTAGRFVLITAAGEITAVNVVNEIAAVNANPVSGATRTWRATITRAALNGQDGLVNLRVQATDRSNNTRNTGVSGNGVDLSKATLAEFDNQLNGGNNPAFTLNPVTQLANETDATRPFVQVSFSGESSEYPLSDVPVPPAAAVTTNTFAPATPGNAAGDTTVRVDSHQTVNLSVARFGVTGGTSTDVTGQIQRTGNNTFLFLPAEPLEVGSRYTLTVNGADVVGNTSNTNFEFTFSVVAPRTYTLDVVPGWNLISFPDVPRDASVQDVFGPNDGIDMVLTYDRSAGSDVGGPWLVAQRGEDGNFSTAQLVTVDPRRAYWVRTSSFETISTVIPRRTVGPEGNRLQPPQINVQQGWNLIGVIDAQIRNRGTNVPTANYLATVNWTFAYTFDTATGSWQRVVPGATNLQVGYGYWLWATSSGVLVP